MMPVAIDHAVAIGADPASLEDIVRRDTALAIWRRPVPEPLRALLDTLDLATIDDLSVVPDAAGIAIALRDAGYPGAVVPALAADIDLLARRQAALAGEDRLALRLEVIETDACRRFHADYITLRLLCTYVGPGTEWHRAEVPGQVERVPTGAAAVFKGRLLLDPPVVLHRSPPISATGEQRLVLVIDPVRPCDVDRRETCE